MFTLKKRRLFARWHKQTDGATAMEYAIIAGMLSIGIVAGVKAVAENPNQQMNKVQSAFVDANGG